MYNMTVAKRVVTQEDRDVTNAFNYLSEIILFYNNDHNNNEVSNVLVKVYNDLYHDVEDSTKYKEEPFMVRKMIDNLKKIGSRDSILKYYSKVIQMNLEQSICFDIKFQESLKKAVTKIDTLKKDREFQQSLEGAITKMGTPENSL